MVITDNAGYCDYGLSVAIGSTGTVQPIFHKAITVVGGSSTTSALNYPSITLDDDRIPAEHEISLRELTEVERFITSYPTEWYYEQAEIVNFAPLTYRYIRRTVSETTVFVRVQILRLRSRLMSANRWQAPRVPLKS